MPVGLLLLFISDRKFLKWNSDEARGFLFGSYWTESVTFTEMVPLLSSVSGSKPSKTAVP